MSDVDEFEASVLDASAIFIAQMSETDHAALEHRVARYLGHPIDGPQPEARELEPEELVVQRLFIGFVEIKESIENLRNIAVYVRRFPYRGSVVTKSAYLRYHVENYLNELYILQERMKAYLTVIARLYRLDSRRGEIARVAKAISRHFSSVISSPVRARGAHVHERRYTDDDLDRLAFFELLGRENDSYAGEHERVYREVRKAKRAWIERTNSIIDRLLDVYFKYLRKLLFDENGRVRVPDALPNNRIQQTATSASMK